MEWLYTWMPIAGVEVFWPGLIILGLGVGIIGGFFGMGGGWMVTPGLNILGFPMAFAIGTDVTQMAGSSLVSTLRHSRFGNVDYKLGLVMVAGTVAGFEVGAQAIMALERTGVVTTIVRLVYLVLLTLIAWLVFRDAALRRKRHRDAGAKTWVAEPAPKGIAFYRTLQRVRVPPMVHFHRAGVICSVWLPVSVGFLTGLLAGFLGIGGGLIRMPALVFLIGVPTHVAVGTDLFEVVLSALYGCASYTYKGRTELLAAVIMVTGAAVGAQIGSVATKYVRGFGIRILFGIAVVGCAISVALKLIGGAFAGAGTVFDIGAAVLILGLVASLSLVIVAKFCKGIRAEFAARRAAEVERLPSA